MHSFEQYTKSLSEYWDQLVGWEERISKERSFFETVLPIKPGQTMLDISCGTGFHAWLFNDLGLKVTAQDGSPNMTNVAKENLAAMGATAITVREMDWDQLKSVPTSSFDWVVCLGSSIPHSGSSRAQQVLVDEAARISTSNGGVVFDHRNFDFLVENGSLPDAPSPYSSAVDVEARFDEKVTFEYRFEDGYTDSLLVDVVRFNEIREFLAANDFKQVNSFGDFNLIDEADNSSFFCHVGLK